MAAREMACLKVMIDLHAADIDERRTAFARLVETAQSFTQIGGTGAKIARQPGHGEYGNTNYAKRHIAKKSRVLQTQPISR
jgi:hypothetical protein